MLNAIELSVVRLNDIMLNVIMLIVVAPLGRYDVHIIVLTLSKERK